MWLPGDIARVAIPAPGHLPELLAKDAARDMLLRKAAEQGVQLGAIDTRIVFGSAVARATVYHLNAGALDGHR